MKTKGEVWGVVIEESLKEINDKIIYEGEREWDERGEGCSAGWLRRY